MEWTRDFKNITKADVPIAGGKGAALGEMTRAGMPVPPGFVVLSAAYEKFLAEGKTPDDVAEEIKKSFEKLGAKRVAVRSSATAEDSSAASWAGQLESYLNTTEKDLLENVKKCWESLESVRASAYRAEQHLAGAKISVAVVVQEMVESEVAGVAFSVHPVSEDRNQMIIEAGLGLGEAVASGTITPDRYVVAKDTGDILDKDIQAQRGSMAQKLPDEEILHLARLVKNIEMLYGFPVDVEWAFAGGKFFIVQSRPITTLHTAIKGRREGAPDKVAFLKSHQLRRQFVYPFIPVIASESYNHCYIENPLVKKIGIEKRPVFIVIWKDNYEEWGEDITRKVTDKETIRFLIGENRAIIKKYGKRADELRALDYKEATRAQLAQLLKEIDSILIETYHRYIFLIHDYFETDDPELIRVLPEVRIEMSQFVEKFYQCCDKIIEALADMFTGIPWETFMYATFDEIIHLLEEPETIREFEKIYKRHLLFVFDGKRLEVIKNQEEISNVVELLRKKEKAVDINATEIKGNSAFGGQAQGNVLKISEFEYGKVSEVIKNKKGFILVTPMTRPEFVPYLKDAGAIVTDEGGLTCHAAIVARELEIPCIVGTKIATRVLNTGDMVEVDAESGIVRVVEKARRVL